MDTYWKFNTNQLCVIRCVKIRSIQDSDGKQTTCLYFSTFALITMSNAILQAIAVVVYYPNYIDSAVSGLLPVQIILHIIPCIIMGLVGRFCIKYDFRLSDVYLCAFIITYMFTSRCFAYVSCLGARLLLESYGPCIGLSYSFHYGTEYLIISSVYRLGYVGNPHLWLVSGLFPAIFLLLSCII